MSVKNAKIWPKGTSFTATTFALVYLLDEAGLRTTSDVFHDLGASNIVDSLWEEGVWSRNMFTFGMRESKEMLEGIQRWRWLMVIHIQWDIAAQVRCNGLLGGGRYKGGARRGWSCPC